MIKKLGMVGVSWGYPQPSNPLYYLLLRALFSKVGVNTHIVKRKLLYIGYPLFPPANISSPTPTFSYIIYNYILTRLEIDFYPQLIKPEDTK